MDFNTAVERIGFPLAVLLFEDALPENTWQTATAGQCLDTRYAFYEEIPRVAGGKKIPESMRDEANRRLQELLAEADFQTAKGLYDKGDSFLMKLAYERLCLLASTFEQAWEVWEIISSNCGWIQYSLTSPYSDKRKELEAYHEKEKAVVTQILYSTAGCREDWVKLINFDSHTYPFFMAHLSEKQQREIVNKLLSDNPTERELLLGYEFPSEHSHYAQAVQADIRRVRKAYFSDFCRLYKKLCDYPLYRADVATAILEELHTIDESAEQDVAAGRGFYPYEHCVLCNKADECGDTELANALYEYVVERADLVTNRKYAQSLHEWIVENAEPDSPEYKKHAVLAQAGKKTRRKK